MQPKLSLRRFGEMRNLFGKPLNPAISANWQIDCLKPETLKPETLNPETLKP